MSNRSHSDFSVTAKHAMPIAEAKISLSTNLPAILSAVLPFKVKGMKLGWYFSTASIVAVSETDNCSIVGLIMLGHSEIDISIKLPLSLRQKMDLDTVKRDLRKRVEQIFPKISH